MKTILRSLQGNQMALKFVRGLTKTKLGIKLAEKLTIEKLKIAVEKTSVDVLNSASSGHDSNAHASKRYRNRTVRLTRSFRNTNALLVGKNIQAITYTPVKYAPHIEYGTYRNRAYPFMYPAIEENKGKFLLRIKKAML